jgi:hypothetical protein
VRLAILFIHRFYDDCQRSQVAFGTYLYHNLKQLQSVLFYVKNHVYSGSENKSTTGLVLRQGYVAQMEIAQIQHKMSYLKLCNCGGLETLESYPTQRMSLPLVDIWACRIYVFCTSSIYVCLFGYVRHELLSLTRG